jgi:tetratricopeptide (TPR) repeat protein
MGRKPRAYQRFFAELKRRRVFNTAAIYGGVAFVVFQAADFVVPALRLADTVATAIVLTAVCAFPVVLTLAWFFDLTPDGMTRKAPPQKGELEEIVSQPRWRRWPSGIAALVGISLLLTGVGWQLEFGKDSGSRVPFEGEGVNGTVAVLPFLDLTGGGEAPYLAEGMAEELSAALMKVPGLTVLPQASRGISGDGRNDSRPATQDPAVAVLLEGSLAYAGDEVALAVLLLDPADGEPLWRGEYLLQKGSFLAELDGIARDLLSQLGITTSGDAAGLLIPSWTQDFDAYRDYLKGKYLSRQGTPSALQSAIEAYHRALVLDPGFRKAWAALAEAYLLFTEYGGPPIPEILPYALAAVSHAGGSGTKMSEGVAASGFLKWSHQWDFRGAEQELQRSIEMDPINPISRYWLARVLTSQRRWVEATEQVDAALELDSQLPAVYLTLGLLLMCMGAEGAQDAFQQVLDLRPEMHPAAFLLGASLALDGDLGGAARAFDRFSAVTGTDPGPFRAYLSALADPAMIPEAVSALSGPGFFGPTQAAALLTHLGEKEAALTLLREAAEIRSPYLLWANALPHFNALRSDPRFQGVLAWVGF